MEKLRNWIANLRVAAKLKVYRMAVLVMTAFYIKMYGLKYSATY